MRGLGIAEQHVGGKEGCVGFDSGDGKIRVYLYMASSSGPE